VDIDLHQVSRTDLQGGCARAHRQGFVPGAASWAAVEPGASSSSTITPIGKRSAALWMLVTSQRYIGFD